MIAQHSTLSPLAKSLMLTLSLEMDHFHKGTQVFFLCAYART